MESAMRSRRLPPTPNKISGRRQLEGFFHVSTQSVSGLAFLRFPCSQKGCPVPDITSLYDSIPKVREEQRCLCKFLSIIKEENLFHGPPIDFSEGSVDQNRPCPKSVLEKVVVLPLIMKLCFIIKTEEVAHFPEPIGAP